MRYHFRSLSNGVLAQLVERLNGIEEVTGSNPVGSIEFHIGKAAECADFHDGFKPEILGLRHELKFF